MQYYPYDSRNKLYRNKLGALAEGDTLRLKLLLHKDAHVHDAYLNIHCNTNDTNSTVYMKKTINLDDYYFYECDNTLDDGIYLYSFSYTSDYGEFKVTKSDHSLGIVSDNGGQWQLTVYKKDFKTPEWLDGGIIYQIFPDRFYSSGSKKENIPEDRYICDDWLRQPAYKQNNEKYSLGNDYYGGDLKGIEQKLDYLKELGVTCIYLNPIFEAHSNHRYNTANYMKIDPSLGTESDLVSLIKSAEKYGISIILDGVFSHTGADSIYFNKNKRYNSLGAYNSKSSPYYNWYTFKNYPDTYSCWWGVPSLPETNENDLSFTNFITGENGVIRYWLKKGVKGWRLDVADELPDRFLDLIRLAVKSQSDENYLLGEVWEDATNKISYGQQRRFLRGRQLDSVMNYPFSSAIIKYLKGGNSRDLIDTVLDIMENYPPQAIKLLMNHIGTHDTARILTILSRDDDSYTGDREWQATYNLTNEEKSKGLSLLKLAAVLQFTLPGVPSIYYGDEAGMTGFGDPFCRAAYPWNNQNTELLAFYKKLGKLRRDNKAFKSGEFIPFYANFGEIVYMRKKEQNTVLIAINRWHEPSNVQIPDGFENAEVIFGESPKGNTLHLNERNFSILIK